MGVLLHWTQVNSFELVVRQNHGRLQGAWKQGLIQGGSTEAIVPLQTLELTSFAMIVYNSENIIRNTRPFCHPLFCHRSVVSLWSVLHLFYSSEPVIRLSNKFYWNLSPNLLDLSRSQNGHLPLSRNWDYEQKLSRKLDVSSSIPINWFISCNNGLFAGTTLTLHESQVHCSGVMQWWTCSLLMSTRFSAG